jgi:hypothetical protein
MAKTKSADTEVAQSGGADRPVAFSLDQPAGAGPFGAQATPVYGGTRMNGTVGAGCDLPSGQSCS